MTTKQGTDARAGAVVGFDPELIHDAIVPIYHAPAPRRVPESAVGGQPVWVSEDVPGYHVSSQCSALLFGVVDPRGSGPVTRKLTRADAEGEGLNLCKWCAAWRQMLTA